MRPDSGSASSAPSTSYSRIRDSRRRWREAVCLTIANNQVATEERPSNELDDFITCTHASCTASSATVGELTIVRAKFTIGRGKSRTKLVSGIPPTRCSGVGSYPGPWVAATTGVTVDLGRRSLASIKFPPQLRLRWRLNGYESGLTVASACRRPTRIPLAAGSSDLQSRTGTGDLS